MKALPSGQSTFIHGGACDAHLAPFRGGEAGMDVYKEYREMEKKKLQFSLNSSYCKSCGICYGLCPRNVLSADSDGKPTVMDADNCSLCRLCELRCPDFAIRVEGV